MVAASGASVDPTKVVNGTAGNDTLTVPAGTLLVNGDGGTDTVLLGAYQYFANYQIVRNADGSIDVTDTHGGSLINTQMVGIATLQFADGSYNVATGQFTSNTTPPPPASPVIDPTKIVNGTPGNDMLTVPAGTQLVNGDGGTDTVVLGAYQYYANYQIVRNIDGSISVSDTHGGSLVGTKMVGIATLQFTDGNYNVATGQFTTGVSTTGGSTTATPTINPSEIVNIAPGNQSVTIPKGTELVNGGGGNDTIVLGAYQYYANYQIVRNADGSIDVTDTHGGSLINTQMIGITTLQFSDGSYNVATGRFATLAQTVNGTSGNDVLTVPTGTQLVNGDGGTDTVAFGAQQYYANYQIARNTDGSIDVSGGSIVNTLMVGIATLQFADGSYNVATGQFTPGPHVVYGTPGNDTLTVPAGTLMVNGDGGTDTVAFGAGQYFSAFQIVRNADGSIDVSGGAITNTQMIGIGTLKFADGSYNVATGQFTPGPHVVYGTPGNDTLTAPAGTLLVNGDGGSDVVSLGANQSFSSYQVVRNADGSIDVSGGGLVNTQMVGIATLQFSDGSYNVATGQFTPGPHVVYGTPGNDTLTVPAGTLLVNGDGGTDTVSLGAYQYYANYQIVRNANGSINVTDTHGGSLTNTQMVGIATLQFYDGSYNVATGQFATLAHTVNGTPGNDVLTVPAGTQLVNGDGGTDTVALGAYQYYANYQIVRNTDGSIDVTDAHGGSLINTQMVGIATLQFYDGSYNVATGQFTSGTATAGGSPTTTAPIINPNEIVNIAPGNQSVTIPAGTELVNGGGGNDTIVLGAYQYYANYQIVRNTNGSIDVTDTHGGSLTNTQMVGITTLQFYDGSYNVATGQFTSGASATTTGGTTGGGTTGGGGTGVITAPPVEQPHQPNDVVAVQIENNGSIALTSRVITFGQTFVDGDVPGGTQLVATIDGQQVAVQMDVKTTNADGSVAEAILTLQAPAIAANGSVDVMLSRATGATTTAGTAIDPHGFVAAGYDTKVALTFHNADGSTSTDNINVGVALTSALAAGTAQTWLSGPLASEVRIDVPINGSLTAQFNIRGNADGTFSTDVQMLNDGIFSAASTNYNYDIAITSHGQSLLSQANVQQAPMQEWEQVVWSNAQGAAQAPADHLVYNVAYLESTGAVDAYTTAAGVTSTEIANELSALSAANTGPLGSDLVTQYEPTTGGRPDIGPTTQWGADWLVSQNQSAEQIMLDNAAASGSEPIHAVNPDGSLVTTANDPNFWLDSRNAGEQQTVSYGTIETQSGWTPDTSHMPDLTYLAALTTGSESAINELQAQAGYDLLSIAPAYRADDSTMMGTQERGIAWTIRDVANAAYLTPNSDPLKAYFTGQVNSIIQNLDTNYVHGALGAEEGQLQGYIMGAFDTNQVAPWQQGYIVVALGQAAAEGFAGANDVLAWMNNFITGLYLNGANGYNPLDGSAYWLTVGSGSLATSNFQSFTSWQQLSDANFAGQVTPTSLYAYPNDPVGGYAAIAKAAVATEWNTTHSAQDLAAFAYITQQTPYLIQNPGGYASAETWNVAPTLLDGHQLQNSEVYYGNGGTTAAATPDGLLAAVSGNNILQAGNGDSILIGGSGSDTLLGGAGNDYLFAGTGAQTLYGGAGTNYLEGHLNGGTGADVFTFKATDSANDTVLNFKPGFDTLDITGGGQGMSLLSLLSSATTDAAGDVVLHLSALHEVTLLGVHLTQLDGHSVIVS
jgi:hypothetical protein